MGATTGISWTDATFNPWWGCAKLSPACKHCYAETLANRWGYGWGPGEPRRFFGEKHWREPLKWNAQAEAAGVQRFVFCASMADVWEGPEGIPNGTWVQMQAARARLYRLVRETPWLVWLFLSKRPERAPELVPAEWMAGEWPSNVWAGATMENQAEADRRAPELLNLPAPLHFASYEPALEDVDFKRHLPRPMFHCPRCGQEKLKPHCAKCGTEDNTATNQIKGLDWIIAGGESGAGARPFNLAWARSVVRQCRAAGASPFVKQLGACAVDEVNGIAGRDVKVPAEVKLYRRLKDGHGADLAEWPEDLRVQERPAPLPVRAAA